MQMQPLTVEPVSLHNERSIYENSRRNFTDTKLMINHVIQLRFISPILLQTFSGTIYLQPSQNQSHTPLYYRRSGNFRLKNNSPFKFSR